MDVSVIIVNYNTKSLLKQCIRSIYQHTFDICFEVIVVDNASSDGSQEMIKEIFPLVKVIENKLNLGFGRANNLAEKIALGEIIFFLNSDTVLLNNAIKILYDFIILNTSVGIVGGNLLTSNHQPTHSYLYYFPNINFEIFNLWFPFYKIINRNAHYNYTEKVLDVGYITGADLMIRKQNFEKIGGFDEDFFMYFEETELSSRIKKMGLRIVSVPEALIIHLEGGDNKEISYSKLLTILYSKKLFYLKVYGIFTFKLLFVYQLFVSSMRLLMSNLLINRVTSKYWKNYFYISLKLLKNE